MKGLVFREFIDMVEDQFSLQMVDDIIHASTLASGGAYTSVGTYPDDEMMQLVHQLSLRSEIPIPGLLNHFGRHLFHRFTVIHPEYVTSHTSAFELLKVLDNEVHVEVRKLYEGAELPSFVYETLDEQSMLFIYKSSRPMADLAHGLIQGCIEHFSQSMKIERIDFPVSTGAHTHFILQNNSDADSR
jgi:hypothetical protein